MTAPHEAAGAYDGLLARAAPVGLVATDEDWRVVACNPAVEQLTGHAPADLLGRSFATLLTMAGRVLHQSSVAPRLLARGEVDEVAVDVVRADGRIVPVLLAVRALEVGSTAYVSSLTPVSERRDYERDLLAARQQADAALLRSKHLHDIARSLAAASSLEEVAAAVALHIRSLGGELDGFWLVDRQRGLSRSIDGAPMPDAVPVGTQRLTLGPPSAELGFIDVARTADPVASGPLVVTDTQDPVLESLVAAAGQAVARLNLLEQLRRQASTDELTGLLNRRLFDRSLASILAERGRRARSLTLFYFDLDGFKAVNDHFGHAAGDVLLRAVADDLGHVLRSYDVLARLGGDEFAAVIRDLDDVDAVSTVAARIVSALRRDIGTLTLGVSVGAVHVPAGVPAHHADLLLHVADEAMYEAKRSRDRSYVVRALTSEAPPDGPER